MSVLDITNLTESYRLATEAVAVLQRVNQRVAARERVTVSADTLGMGEFSGLHVAVNRPGLAIDCAPLNPKSWIGASFGCWGQSACPERRRLSRADRVLE